MSDISLSRAFLRVLWARESDDGVPFTHRYGIPPDHFGEIEPINDIAATGPKYVEKFTTMGQPVPLSKAGGVTPEKATLARLPCRERLQAMLLDQEGFPDQTSEAEKRSCAAHSWLVRALVERKLRAWAIQTLLPHNVDAPLISSRLSQVDIRFWPGCGFDYHLNRAFPVIDGSVKFGQLTRSGELVLSEIVVEEEALNGLLAGATVIRLILKENEDGQWTISVNGRPVILGEIRSELLLRGLRSIELLARYRDLSIPNHLLEALAGKIGETRPQSIERARIRFELREALNPIADQVRQGSMRLSDAKERVAEIVARIDPPTLPGGASPSNHNASEKVGKGIKRALEEIVKADTILSEQDWKTFRKAINCEPQFAVIDSTPGEPVEFQGLSAAPKR